MAMTPVGPKLVDLLSFFPKAIGEALRAAVGTVGTIAGTGNGQSAFVGSSAGNASAADAGGTLRSGAARFAPTAAVAKATMTVGNGIQGVVDVLVKVAQTNPALAAQAASHLVQAAEANSPRVAGVWQNSNKA